MMTSSLCTFNSLKKHTLLLIYKAVAAFVNRGYVGKNTFINYILFGYIARMGSIDAQYELAMMFRHGKYAYPSNQRFEYWAYLAYDQGHIGAIFELAKYYRCLSPGGRRITEDKYINYIDLAYEQFEIAAEAGMVEAQELLADMYRIGEGVGVPDWDGAICWYNQAASNGSESAQEMRDYMIDSLGLSDWLPDSVKVDWFSSERVI